MIISGAGVTIQITLMSCELGALCGVPVHLKLEHQQVTASFKLRGATNAVSRLTPQQRAKGVVSVSTGNHGRGLAIAAREAGVRCIICMSQLVPANKIQGIRAQGAEVRITGQSTA
jgi:threonine dehydratase